MRSKANRSGFSRGWASALMVLIAHGLPGQAPGPQTIINVPSDALTPKGRHFVLHESQILPNERGQGFGSTNFYTYGLTDRTELAATLYNLDNAGSREMALGLGFKSVFPILKGRLPDLETKLTLGHLSPISLRPSGQVVGFFTFGHVSFDVPRTDLRLLAGVAGGSRNLLGEDAASFIGGVEYPITDHLSFTGEWFSGRHNFSGLIPGLTYHRDDLIVVAGYEVPNDGDRRDAGVVLEVGYCPGASAIGG